MGKIAFRLQSAAAHKGVGDADGGCASELHPYVKFIILSQKGIVNDAKKIPAVVDPVFRCKPGGHLLQLLRQTSPAGDLIVSLQHGRYALHVLLLKLPEPDSTGIFLSPGVGHIEHIAQLRVIPLRVDEGDAFGATADIPPHGLVPDIVLSAGRGIRALGVDHDLLIVGIFVEPCCCGQKIRPSPVAAGELPGRFLRHTAVCL